MLQIGHRESRDVDIFLPDPQLLSYLDPQLRDFRLDVTPVDYQGDGARFLKLAFGDLGEVDFIVADSLTDEPTTRRLIEGEDVRLETVAEIIAKKIRYRGSSIKPRDIFDIAAAGRHDHSSIVSGLKAHREEVDKTLLAIERLNPAFITATISALAVRDPYRSVVATAIEEAKALLRAVRTA